MAIPKTQLREVLVKAYEAGYYGCLDLANSFADDAMAELCEIKDKGELEWKIYKVKELTGFPVGTRFEHLRLGPCKIIGSSDSSKQMEFENRDTALFMEDTTPWNEPMRKL